MTRDEYLALLRDLLSADPARVREANRRAYATLVDDASVIPDRKRTLGREADLILARVPQPC